MAQTFMTDIRYHDQFIQNRNSQEALFFKTQYKERRWANLLKKISFEPNESDFYQHYPVKPGFSIWKTLSTCEMSLKHLKGVRIPSTFVILGSNNHYWLKYDEERNCMVRKNELQSTINDFESSLDPNASIS
jgi:hypothetical protein